MAEDGEKPARAAAAPVSFGFTRTTGRRRFLIAAGEDGSEPKQELDFLSAVEGQELQSVRPAPQPKELIIPLIQKNQWKKPEGSRPLQEQDEINGVEAQAVRELIEESKKSLEQRESGTKVDPEFAIPLLMQNRVPNNYETGERVDVSLRPDSSTEADYEEVPVEAYGLAMLKGMGWKLGEGIGRTFKQDVKPLENRLRPKGLGLGADCSAAQNLQPSDSQQPLKPGEEPSKSKDELLGLIPGGAVFIETGPHKELYGKIEGVDGDNARVMVKLAIGGKTVTVSQHGVRPVTQKEYDKLAKDLSHLSKARKEEVEQRNGAKRDAVNRALEDRKDQDQKGRDKKRKHPGADRNEHAGKQSKSEDSGSNSSSRAPHWLRQDLRVRFVDKFYKGGKYYNTKMVIEDVLKPDTCVCRTEEGQILDGIHESMLETVIPRNDTTWVMVVLGKHAGQVGRILHREKEHSRALVQLQQDEERLMTLDYDAVCHYVGGSEDD
ncbi:G-patch domain and KOW motifs-containing protein [Varanus komodoensis]|uniref:G-patch domain and KOW motifs-containing protein n=1 Tax=Varanus komodoensis TaxID=61221 RepID=A0A8D2KWF9_VARKO|nr:G-patch domain and KOW motifs-containing protein [Varanus komodoensis]KAF7243892.1 G-patch domain and KOW motifs-containing protein [Varanus komodoensis]